MKKIVLFIFISALIFSNQYVSSKDLYNYNQNGVFESMSTVSQVRASHILVDTEDEAVKIKEDISEGKITFAEAARKFSKCPSGKSGGDLGFFGRRMMVPEFDEAAFTLPIGEVSFPVKTQFGYHLILITGKK